MSNSDQLRELEATIRQRQLYLQAQDNQVQHNLQLLKTQKAQLAHNKAQATALEAKVASLTTDSQKALLKLKKQAEDEPSARYVKLAKQCEVLERQLEAVRLRRVAVEDEIGTNEEHLHRLDGEIIEADAILKDLRRNIKTAGQRLFTARRSAEFQAGVVSNLQYDIEKMEKQFNGAHNLKLALEKDQDIIAKDINNKTQTLKTIENSIVDRQTELGALNTTLTATTKSLKQLNDKDRDFRRNLAEEKLRIAREKENNKVAKQALKKELDVQKQLNPKFKLKVTDGPQHFKI